MKLKIKKILPLIGIALFVYLIVRTGPASIIKSFAEIKLGYLLLSFVFILPIILMQTWKWYIVVKEQGISLSFGEAFKIQFIALFYGFITPARIGTFIKIAYLQDKTKNLGKSTSSVLIERILDMIVVLTFAALGSLMLLRILTNPLFFNITKWMFFLLILFSLFSLLLISKRIGKAILEILYKKLLPKKLQKKGRKSWDGFYKSIPKKRFLILPLLATFVTWFLIYTPNFFIAKSLGINVPFFIFIFLFAIATIIAELPISISGLGVREAALITMLQIFNAEPSKVMSLSIISIIILTAIPALFGFFLSLKEHKSSQKKLK